MNVNKTGSIYASAEESGGVGASVRCGVVGPSPRSSLARSLTVTKESTYSDQLDPSRGPEESELVELWRTCPARQDALFS